jgi:hypothetical protein
VEGYLQPTLEEEAVAKTLFERREIIRIPGDFLIF